MVAPLIPIVVGGALAAGGTAAAIAGAKTKGTKPKKDVGFLGGSSDRSDQFSALTDAGLIESNVQLRGGNDRLARAGNQSSVLAGLGGELTMQARQQQQDALLRASNVANGLAGFSSGAPDIGSAVGQQALDQGRQQALSLAGAARGGNIAAATRGALEANQVATENAAAQAQITAGQQALAADQMRLTGLQAAGGLMQTQAGLFGQNLDRGLGLQTGDVQTQAGIGSTLLDTGASREATFMGGKQGQLSLEGQLQTQIEIERAKAQQNKRDNLFRLGGGMLGGAGSAVSSAGGG